MNKKIIASVLAVVFTLSIVAVPVSGATVEELQEQINQLTALIASLQAQLAGQTSTPSTGAVCFHTDLEHGMTSAEVLKLQQTLNLDPATRVAASGAGAPGSETTYFGSLTLAAVKAFQAKHGIITTGYVGPLTRAQLNALYCTPTPPTTVPDETPTTTTTVAPAYGTLSVVSYPVSNPVTTLYGSQTYETVAGQYKATGSDMTIRKVAVKIISSSNTALPWQAFSAISVWDGSTMLAELPVTQANAIQNTWAQDYTFNLSGFNLVIPNGTQKVLTVKVTTVANPIAAATGVTWKVSLLTDVVSTDTAGVTYSTVSGSAITTSSLTLSGAQTASFTITAAADNPKAGNVIGSSSATTRVEVLKFNVKNNSDLGATFNSGTVTATSTSATSTVSVELWDGGTQIAAAAPNAAGEVEWTNFTLPIAANATKTLTVKLVIAQLAPGYADEDTVEISVGPVLSGVDANGNVANADGSISAVGATQTIYLTGPIVSLSSTSFDVTGSTTQPNSIGKAKIVFSITAAGTSDVYIGKASSATSTITPTPAAASSSVANGFTCTSGVTTDSTTGWRIAAGSTATCELNTTIELTGSYDGQFYQVAAKEIYWGTSSGTYTTKYTGNLSDFITSQGYLSYSSS